MSFQNLDQAWEDVKEKVINSPGTIAPQAKAFFGRLQPQAMSDGFLMITADNDFIQGWIDRHMKEQIAQACEELYGMPFMVMVEVDPNQKPPEPAAAPAAQTAAQPVAQAPAPAEPEPAPQPAAQPVATATEPQVSTTSPAPAEQKTPARKDNRSDSIKTLTFENFVIGESNRLAYSMAVNVADEPGTLALNPLFIYGKSGLGKTHLLRAIQNQICETYPNLDVVYVDSAEFVDEFTEGAIAHDRDKRSFRNFKTRYESADVLLIDDVQFFQGKKSTLDMVFQIFNKLKDEGKQIVLAADRAPKNIDVDERYQSRFSSGGICDIQPPDVETKLGIIRSFTNEYKRVSGRPDLVIPRDVELYIAEVSSSNVRELKSAVTKVVTHMLYATEGEITVADVRGLLESHFSSRSAVQVTVESVQQAVENFYRVSHADLVGKKRQRNITHARQVAIYLSRQLIDVPFADIGKKFNRDHSTIMYSYKCIEEKLDGNRDLNEEMEALRKEIMDL
ncbi:MAG: chromosomal replication initiator protein DnaA [Coriobacteriia bacterium]|nr:chromosomal replication initiator protein DnaA [Coriobacteriia bacterium]